MIKRVAVIALAGLALTTLPASMLPERLGAYTRGNVSEFRISAADNAVLLEYGLRRTERAEFANPVGRKFATEAFQFSDSEGGHAAYLWLRPQGAARSTLGGRTDRSGGVWGETFAVVAGGMTVVGRKNYVFRFRGGAPEASELRDLLNSLKDVDPTEPSPDECCAYIVEGSERILLGPASLARLVPRIRPSTVGFHLGVKGRTARFEMPSGPIVLTVFEYRSADTALERASQFERIRGAFVRVEGRSVGVILDPSDRQDAEGLLRGIDRTPERTTVGWDPRTDVDGPLTLEGGIGAMLVGALLGLVFAVPRYLVRWHEGIPEVPLGLRI